MARADAVRRVRALREWQRFLDGAFRVPGTSMRFGWDPIIGLIPWAGDVLGALMSCALILQAHHMRVPRVVQLRMLMNIGIDVLLGVVPFVGDIADFFWKSNTKNLALIERHVDQAGPATAGDWLFVAGAAAVILLIAAIPLLVMYWIVNGLFGRPLL